jgi:hypothetical protein
MTIKEWEQKEIVKIIRFVDKRIENNARNPNACPLKMDKADWDSAFNEPGDTI